MQRRALAIFTFSGAAGLIFEVALQRSVARAFGVSAFATSTVLASYMAGLALGAVVFGRLADRSRKPARLYALLEAGVGLCALLAAPVTRGAIELFALLAHGAAPDDTRLIIGRLVLSFALTLVPTVLMGGTLPAMGRALHGKALATLYTANMLGAAVGAGLGAYVLLPALGLTHMLWLGAGLNFIAAALAWNLVTTSPMEPQVESVTVPAPRALWPVLALSAWSGLATFIAEVDWFHLLAVVVGSSAYAFGLMLAVFLAGLTLGSHWVARQPAERITFATVGRVQLGVAIAIAVSLLLWERVPNLFVIAGAAEPPFFVREGVRALACVELMLIPSALLGAVYPLVLRLTEKEANTGWAIGRVAAVNTLGAVVGALGTGFVLLPLLEGRGVLLLLVFGAASVALVSLPGRARLIPIAVVALTLLLPSWNLGKLASGANVYFTLTPYAQEEVLWARESVSSGLTSVVRAKNGTTTLLTNGKFQGNDTGEVTAQRGFSQVPLLAQRHFGRALLIGVGTGCSLATLAAQPFEHVEAAELSKDILDASRTYFGTVNDHVLEPSSRVALSVADGRNLLLLSEHQYDLVALELSSIWFAGASDLYNQDFYALVKRRLAPEGVLQQWVQLHHLTRRDLAVILNSAARVFRYVHLYFVGGQGIVLASDASLDADVPRLNALSERLRGTSAVEGLTGGDITLLTGRLALDTNGIQKLVEEEAKAAGLRADQLVSTDDNLWLEYSTPKANARRDLSAEALLDSINALLADAHPTTGTVRPEDAVHLQAAWLIARDRFDEARAVLEAGPRDAWSEGLRTWLKERATEHE